MADTLAWKEGEGEDVHLLRGGSPSRKLYEAVAIDGQALDSSQLGIVTLVPQFIASVSDIGVEIDTLAGTVRALPHPNPDFPRINNFLVFVVFDDTSAASQQVAIRIHVHDSIEKFWLTPSPLTIHLGADECRFTVLARFDDQCVGDITDWPDLTCQSADPGTVQVLADGTLQGVALGQSDITARVVMPTANLDVESDPAQAIVAESWASLGQSAGIDWVAGRRKPDATDPASVRAIVERGRNILFIAEGFRSDQRFDYRNVVNVVARVLRGEGSALTRAFQPFHLLKDSFNYWSVFVPSGQDGISAVGEYVHTTVQSRLRGYLADQPRPLVARTPQPPATTPPGWFPAELIYKVGWPVQADAERPLQDLVDEWQQLFGDEITLENAADTYNGAWKLLPFRSLPNERDSLFGVTVGVRPRASASFTDRQFLLLNRRRTRRESLQQFVASLTLGGYPIGERWQTDGKDFGLVCFVCLTDRSAGTDSASQGYFATSTGQLNHRIDLRLADNSGFDIETGPVKNTPRHIVASVVAHECGHALGLGDEYGDGRGASQPDGSDSNPADPNVQAKVVVAPPPVGTDPLIYDPTQIRWLWPRIVKAGVLSRKPGPADHTAAGINVPLLPGHGKTFAVGDVVRFKEWPVLLSARFDTFQFTLFKVTTRGVDAVGIIPVTGTVGSNAVTEVPSGGFDDAFFDTFEDGRKYTLIVPRREAGVEVTLVADAILKHIAASRGPLNAPAGDPTATCVMAQDSGSNVMTPSNLPALTRTPRTKADIVGIYEGGSYHDCGIFRPAGRCRMRFQGIITTPFCHVCRYILVDTVDPTQHGDLDQLYPEVKA